MNTPNFETFSDLAGKNLFMCFFKILTALGCVHTKHTNSPTSKFILSYITPEIEKEKLINVFNRYEYYSKYVTDIMENTKLYYGINVDGNIEYGMYSDKNYQMGLFKLTESRFNWILLIKQKSAANLKADIIRLDSKKIMLLGKIKKTMSEFRPGVFEKRGNTTLNGEVISFPFYGAGKWLDGQIDKESYEVILKTVNAFLMKNNWYKQIQYSVNAHEFWITINIKLK